ncbi:translocation/assembly module TamB domain-containing protein [Dysgonomonas sp. Marseille-P4677]|uniref:translocation/assembly module TamB domain-containing protein n=1 Tax=Dysgonomonas sp. Marseille-P4677 TaxID=2364790 RepID=UPI001911A834|nr:translocation/assembly module TamB domain-containing protein [Dysgonomonas sp. Marseille-P4677]MBK5721954.1 translocation/assembly module TamB domain-containing protein [Dysgonomonas sp. Marseille-P4677]
MPPVQEYVKDVVVKELKKQIGTELGIGRLYFLPFNTLALDSVYLYDQSNQKVLMADRISAGVDLFALMHGDIEITSAWLSDFEVRLSKDSVNAPLNIQYIIDAFKPKDNKPKSQLNIKLDAINITNGQFYFDIKDKLAKPDQFDVNHIHVTDFAAKLTVKSIQQDSLNIQVKKISLKEKSGIEISDLVFRVLTEGKKISVKGFDLDLPSSHLAFEKFELDLTPTSDTAKILDYAVIDLEIAPSFIAPKDIATFVPSLRHFKDAVNLQGRFSGTLDNLTMDDFSINYGEKMHLVANAEVRDGRNPDKMYILGSVDDFRITSAELESIIQNISNNKKPLPKQLKNLGTISFTGDISGYLKQLNAFGSLETNLGIVKTDVLFGFNPRNGVSSYVQGKVYTSDFALGKLLDNNELDKVSFNLAVDIEKPTSGKIKGMAKGDIHDFGFKGYTYKEITLNANYDGLRIDGQLNIDDQNGMLNVNGLFDLSDKDRPVLNFKARVKSLQLGDLHLAKNMAHSYLSMAIDADFSGKNIDDAEGYIRVDSIDFIREDKVYQMDSLVLKVSGVAQDRKLKLQSNQINGEINGAYSFSTLIGSIQQTLHPYLPALINIDDKKRPDDKVNMMNFDFQVHNTESLSNILSLPVTVLSTAKIIGSYNNINDKFNLEIFTPSIKAAGMNIKSGYIVVKNPHDTIDANINLLVMAKNNAVNDVAINSRIKDNLINTNISLVNTGIQKARGNFSISTLFTKYDDEPIRVDVGILPSQLLLNNKDWKMDESHIAIQDGLVAVDKFFVYNQDGSQEIKINGKYTTKNSSDILKAELKNIDLEYIFQTLAIDALRFGGYATGSLFVSSVEKKPYANTRLEVKDFKFNGTELGKLNLFSELDDETNKVVLDGLIVSKESKQTKVDGTLDPIGQKLSIYFDADSVDISFLNKYAESVFQDISGRGTGKVHLYGNFSDVTVEGKAFVQDGGLGIKFLNTRYTFTDTVYLKKDLIYFNDIVLKDQYNNTAHASGKVAHDFFSDFMYMVNLSANKFLVYNATPQQNPLFYGRVYGSGNGSIGGDEKSVDVHVSMRTEENSIIRMNFMDEAVNEYSFITYKSENIKDSIYTENKIKPKPILLKSDSGMDINLDFYIDATPDATIELVMDPVGGDILRGTGNGAIQFQWNMKGSPRLYGTYNIQRGSYNFTFQRIMERRFTIQDGSNVQFRGDPFDATLDVNAIYKVNASLSDLDKTLSEFVGQTTIPVNCVLNLTGPLKRPNVGLDITFPSADPEVERQVKSIINTQDEINKQVAFLLILSKFKSPNFGNPGAQTSDFAALASATLSNQLTKIVSKIDDRWQLGTNIRYSDAEWTNTEAELLLSSQLLNDRLLINGNFGYRNDMTLQNEAMITDVDIEYLLNNSGTWRIKAYNHFNEKYYYVKYATQTQGVGVVYKKDFDDLYDLFKGRKLKYSPPMDTIPSTAPDSTKKGSSLSPFIKIKE